MKRGSTRSLVVAAALLLGVFAGCADEPDLVVSSAQEKYHFAPEEVRRFVAAADLVVEGTVVSSDVGRKFGDGEGSLWFRDVTLEVKRVFKGDTSASAQVEFEETGWDSEKPMLLNGYGPSQPGDSGIYFFTKWDNPEGAPSYQVMTHAQGRFLFVDGQVEGPDSADPLVAAFEKMTPSQLRERLREASP